MKKTMKATVVVSAPDGTLWHGEVELAPDKTARPARQRRPGSARASTKAGLTSSDLKLPMRAFLRKFASNATAAGKFVLVVAHLVKGATGKGTEVAAIKKAWTQNSGVLGGRYQTVYGTRSKEKGWVDSQRRGMFVLMDGWQEAANG